MKMQFSIRLCRNAGSSTKSKSEKPDAERTQSAVFDPTLPRRRIFGEVQVRKSERRENTKHRFRSDSAATQDLRRGPSPESRTPREHKAPLSIRLCRDAAPRKKPTLANIRGKSKIRICHERVDGPTRLFHILKNIPKSYAGDSEILYLCKDSPRRISTLTHFKTHKLKRLWYLTKNSVW